jgi:Fe-S-cluster-containing hydrogenase component 2
VQACPFGAIFPDDEQHKVKVCVYCGYCARYCPYEVIAVEEIATAPEVTDAAR